MLTKSYSPKVGFVSLGCPKAGSDTEKILSRVKAEGYEISSNFINSDLVIVNTCGFIDSAIEESLEAIDEAMQKKRQRYCYWLFRREKGNNRGAL